MEHADGTHYTYSPETIPPGVKAINIGWLEPRYSFPQGEAPRSFTASLAELIAEHPKNRTRGWHRCQLGSCGTSAEFPIKLPHGEISLLLGSAEARVVAQDGTWMIAPNLVFHYVEQHSYLPPKEFIEAVTVRRVAPDVDLP